jgi:hypothetical protein
MIQDCAIFCFLDFPKRPVKTFRNLVRMATWAIPKVFT